MKIQLIVFVLIAVCQSDTSNIEKEWKDFKVKYNKKFSSSEEDLCRFKNFVESYEYVTRFNRLQAQKDGISNNTLELGINEYSDLPLNELSSGLDLPVIENLTEHMDFITQNNSCQRPIPNSFDWRMKGIVTPVKNQKMCKSSWAFSAVGSLEAMYYKNHNDKQILSEQFLIDCDTNSLGCNGGYTYFALQLISQTGIPTEKDYPYEGLKGKCKNVKKSPVKNKFVSLIPNYNESILKHVVACIGPVSAVVYASTKEFQNYRKGVLKAKCPPGKVDHAVVIVGYDTDPKEGDYWIVKNSWGTSWGDKGYIKIPRNKDNYCGIASFPIYPFGV